MVVAETSVLEDQQNPLELILIGVKAVVKLKAKLWWVARLWPKAK
jgi:hypothetical protein